jgi:ketosteroid isomerase-like protein
MSEENIEALRRAYDAFNCRDLAASAALMHPDFALDFSNSMGPERGVYRGVDGIRRLFELYWDAFESITIELEEVIGTGDVVVAMVHARGRGRGSGVEIDARGPHVWSFLDGRIVGFTLFQRLDQALEAAGLSE